MKILFYYFLLQLEFQKKKKKKKKKNEIKCTDTILNNPYFRWKDRIFNEHLKYNINAIFFQAFSHVYKKESCSRLIMTALQLFKHWTEQGFQWLYK